MDSSVPDSSSINLDMIRKTATSRRGGVRVRGGRLPPISIRDVPTTSSKKVIAPKIPQRRIKKEVLLAKESFSLLKRKLLQTRFGCNTPPTKSSPPTESHERAPALYKDDRKDFRKPFSRGRGQRVYIQTEGSFLEQGPAFRLKKETVVPHYDRIPRSSSRMKLEMENKISAEQLNLLLEECDEKNEYLDYKNDMQPVRFPCVKKKSKLKIKEEILDNADVKPKIKEEILDDEDIKPKIKEEILDNEDVKPRIKKEPEDDTEETKVNWLLPDVKTIKEETPEPKICSLMEAIKLSQEEDVFVLFQLPSSLPFKRCDDSWDEPKKKDRNSTGQFEKVEKSEFNVEPTNGANLEKVPINGSTDIPKTRFHGSTSETVQTITMFWYFCQPINAKPSLTDIAVEAKGTNFKDMPEGSVGKLQITKSGRMRLALGSVDIAIENGVNEGSMAEVVSIPLANEDEGDFIVLGKIYQKMIMHPILTDSEKEIRNEETSE